jgi:hypothetical protein
VSAENRWLKADLDASAGDIEGLKERSDKIRMLVVVEEKNDL